MTWDEKRENPHLRVCTFNLPRAYLAQMDALLPLYPSRSEMVRVAVREFLIRELALLAALPAPDPIPVIPVPQVPAGWVDVPGRGLVRLVQREGRS